MHKSVASAPRIDDLTKFLGWQKDAAFSSAICETCTKTTHKPIKSSDDWWKAAQKSSAFVILCECIIRSWTTQIESIVQY
jgi:hypothetical protein